MEPDPFALPAFVLSIVSLIVAVVGAGTGIIALVWQIITRTRGAHRIKVRVVSGMRVVTGAGSQGPYYDIDVSNRGAAAVQIRQWSIRLPDGNGLVTIPAAFPPQPSLPYTLEAGSSVSFYVLSSAIIEAAAGRDLSKARGTVHLGTGQIVVGKRGEIKVP